MNILRIAGRIVADYIDLASQVEDALKRTDLELDYRCRPIGDLSEDDLFQLSVWLDARIEGRESPAGLPKDIVLVKNKRLLLLPMVDPNGDSYWVDEDDNYHREDGPAVIYHGGHGWYHEAEAWYKHGELHREGGPAVVGQDGAKFWYRDGQRHREDGPAVIRPDGTEEWWLNDEEVPKEEVMGS